MRKVKKIWMFKQAIFFICTTLVVSLTRNLIMYTVQVDNRPKAEDRLDAFNAVLQDLE